MEFFRIQRDIPFMRYALIFNVISILTFLIAVGAILPGIGGSFTRFGYVEVLYVTELLGLLVIWAGYRLNTRVLTGAIEPERARPAG